MNDHPLLRVLIAEATRRGHTLAMMAKHLGVSYRRIAQWRSNEADVSNARREVIAAAAGYLGIPTVYVLCLAGAIGPKDFLPSGRKSLQDHVQRELAQLSQDPYFAGLVPEALRVAHASVQQFVVLLYRELDGRAVRGERAFEWTRTIQLAAMGSSQALAELASLRNGTPEGT